MRKGMIVDIYGVVGQDASANGISSRNKTVLLIGANIPQIFEDHGVRPVVRIENHYKDRLRAVEVGNPHTDKRGPMFGGCFIFSCDSRFPNSQPVALHDRFETT